MLQTEISAAAVVIDSAAKSLISTFKYVYLISADDFNNVNVKDIFKVALNDITRSDSIENLGLRLDSEKIKELNTSEFAQVENLIRYAFAVRLPFLKRSLPRGSISGRDIKSIYKAVSEFGMDNPENLVGFDLKSSFKASKTNRSEPAFDSGWFRRWVYSYGNNLAIINNRNMFFLGCADALFPLYYSTLTEELVNIISKHNNK